jgi:hypothetical protein
MISAVFSVRSEPTAEASLAAMRERNRFGMAMAAMIKMMATTIKSSISENPFWRFIFASFLMKPAVMPSFSLVSTPLDMARTGRDSRWYATQFSPGFSRYLPPVLVVSGRSQLGRGPCVQRLAQEVRAFVLVPWDFHAPRCPQPPSSKIV